MLAGSSGIMSQHTLIDHNYFYRQTYSGSNGGESIRVGSSEYATSNAYTTVEYNLFEQCNGDPEVISVKSSNNILRYNTFRNNDGSLVLRHGGSNTVDGNLFIHNTGGIRLYGHNEKIINNYFEGNTGTGDQQAIVIGTATVQNDVTGSNSEYGQVRDTFIGFNTFVNNTSGIVVGYAGKTYSPYNVTIAYNILKSDSGTLLKYITGQYIHWKGNMLYGKASIGNIPSTGYTFTDPQLELKSDGVYRLKSSSPAINMAGTQFSAIVKKDMDGQDRSNGNLDCGADEYSAQTATNKPLIKSDVGQDGTYS
jgi:poly(beta-D-mannuronate) lyase